MKDYQSIIFQLYPIILTESLFIGNKEGKSPATSSHLKGHEPIILFGNSSLISVDFKSLCAKGPSFIPTSLYVDWLQLQKDFNTFSNRVRARFIFRSSQSNSNNINNTNSKNNSMSINQPPRKKPNWKAAKTTSPELETFLSNVERSLFGDISRKAVSENLSKGEKDSLWNWRKTQLFNPCGDLVLRSQDKGNRFVIVDKETDKLKAEEQIKRSSFVKLNYDPTFDHIAKVKAWAEK